MKYKRGNEVKHEVDIETNFFFLFLRNNKRDLREY